MIPAADHGYPTYYDMKSFEAVIFMGLQGSGKTWYYNQWFSGKYEHISLDELHTRNKEAAAVNACLAAGRCFVIDNTNPTKADRARYISPAKEHGFKVIGYFFQSKLKDCIRRNDLREGKAKLPAKAIAATSNKLEMPSYDEGFDELYFVERDENDKMIPRKWRVS